MAEKDLVSYWDNFLAIAFDNSQKAMLTTCCLKRQDFVGSDANVKCCFSFTIRRDAQHNMLVTMQITCFECEANFSVTVHR